MQINQKLLDDLNENQKKAVSHKNGPCLIIAGAGTGKTTVITRKIAYVISKKWAKPSEILALTFTDKAAEEMEQRVDMIVPYGFVDTRISTFHAFGDRVLRDHALELGLPANFKILSQTEQAIFMRENLYAFDLKHYRPIANPISHISELLQHFSRLKDELIAPEEYLRFAQNKKLKIKNRNDKEKIKESEQSLELANAYQRYQDIMIQNGNLDYGDQIFFTYKLLKENPAVLKSLQVKFKYILVDEFQDTNFAQYQIVKLLAGKSGNLTVVGDDDQSIYRFRGASISNILSFKKDFPMCRQIVLNKNYRSTRQILDAAYKLICHNNPDRLEVRNKVNKKLTSSKSGMAAELIYADTLSAESDRLCKEIMRLKKQKKYQNRDFAILARANSHLEPFIKSLKFYGIDNVFVGASSLFSQPEIKMLVAYLRCLVKDDDNLSFFTLATSELYNASVDDLVKYYSLAKKQNKSFEELFDQRLIRNDSIALVVSDLRKYRGKLNQNSTGEILYQFLTEKKLLKKLMKEKTTEAEVKILNIARFFDRITQFDRTSDNKSVLAFLENLELILSVGDEVQSSDVDPDLNAVNLMTVHSAKGLEWPVVFIVNCVVERFPSRERKDKIPISDDLIKEKLPEGDFHLQEERRLFYVGATRAKDLLYLTAAQDYGAKRLKKLSQFVLELLDNPDLEKQKHKLSPLEKIEAFKKTSAVVSKLKIKNFKLQSVVLKLSRQQIDDYYTCPQKYYFASIVKIPLPTNWHFMYGTAIHEAIGRYFTRKLNKEKPTLKSMIEDFEQSFKSEGFITREHEEERKRKGIETLAKFYDEDQKVNLVPQKIEEQFDFYVGSVKITGRYDLIKGSGDEVEICDFKTSDVKDQKDAERRIKESTQMMIYALAWREKHSTTPITSLIFIESDLSASKKFSNEDLEKTKKIISDVARGIRASDFKATPDLRQCSLCSFREICPDAKLR